MDGITGTQNGYGMPVEGQAEEIGAFLRVLRKRNRRTPAEVARAASVSPSTLWRWETGRHAPREHELRAVLEALGASGEETLGAFALLPGARPRQVAQAVREAAKAPHGGRSGAPAAGMPDVPLPGAGDLWRALRLRRGLSARQVAAALGVHPSALTRWEHSEAAPPEELLPALFGLLGAAAEERAALSQRRLALTPSPPEDDLSPGALEAKELRLHAMFAAMQAGEFPLGDLGFLAHEARLWPRAARDPAARRVLGFAYTLHAEWLFREGRTGEVGEPAWRAAELVRSYARHDWYLGQALCLSARHAARGGTRGGHLAALRLLQGQIGAFAIPRDHSTLWRDMAEYAGHAGRIGAAIGMAARARELAAEDPGDPYLSEAADFIRARLHLDSGDPAAALALLEGGGHAEREGGEGADRGMRALRAALMARALLEAGDRGGAAFWLGRFYGQVAQPGLGRLRSHGDAVAARL